MGFPAPVSRLLARSMLALLVLAALPKIVLAERWQLTPSLSLSETWTDNLELAPDSREESAFVTTVAPGVSLSGGGARLQGDLAYGLSAVFEHTDEGSDELFHNLNGRADAELVQDHLFVDVSATASQNISDLRDAAGVGVTSGNDNLTQNYGVTAAPRLTHRLGRVARATWIYEHERVWFEDEQSDQRVHRAQARIESGSLFQRLRWALNGSYEDVAELDGSAGSDGGADGTLSSGSLTLGYALTPRFEINATGGYEDNDIGEVDPQSELAEDREGSFWDVGIRWRPNRRLNLELGGGERFFGRSLRAALSYQRRVVSLQAEFSESLQNNTSVVFLPEGSVPVFAPDCPAGVEGCTPAGEVQLFRQDTVDGFFVARRLSSSVSFNFRRHSLVLTGFRLVREAQRIGDDERQVGGSLNWRWALGSRTSFGLGGRYSREQFEVDERQDDFWFAEATLSRQLGRSLAVEGSYRHQRQESDDAGAEFTENAVVLSASFRY